MRGGKGVRLGVPLAIVAACLGFAFYEALGHAMMAKDERSRP